MEKVTHKHYRAALIAQLLLVAAIGIVVVAKPAPTLYQLERAKVQAEMDLDCIEIVKEGGPHIMCRPGDFL